MKKQEIIIIGVGLSGVSHLFSKIKAMEIDAIIAVDKEQSKSIFERESIPIHNFREDFSEPLIEKHKFYENEPSKFIGKPRNNFKRR